MCDLKCRYSLIGWSRLGARQGNEGLDALYESLLNPGMQFVTTVWFNVVIITQSDSAAKPDLFVAGRRQIWGSIFL